MRAEEDADLADMAARASRVTHGSTEAQVACALYSLVARRLLSGWPDREEVIVASRRDLRAVYARHGIPGSALAADPRSALEALDAFEAWPGREGRGHVVDSFWSAWDAFAMAADYPAAVTAAVRYGNDTDTTAAIAGGLAGIYWGLSGIPVAWRRGLRDRPMVQDLVDRLVETDVSEWDGSPWRTSRRSPLRVDPVDLAGTRVDGSGGRLGITFLPGKRYLGYYSGPHWRDLDSDAERLHTLGVDVLLLLVEDHELERCRVPDLGPVLTAHGVEVVRHPIRDARLPDDGSHFREVLTGLLERIAGGTSLAVACRGGLDRSGMATACLLAEAGLDPDEAIARVQAARRHALTLPEQQAYVREWPPRG